MYVEHCAPAIRQTTTPHHLPPPLVMLPSSRPVFLSNVAKHVAHFFITHAGPWVWAIAIEVAQGVLGLAHQLAVARAARCVPFFFFFSPSMPWGELGVSLRCCRVLRDLWH